ncbi:hypothetical protein [Aromatoleum evansii]|uniref:hypothetical protein n=1 Tax=Aromatoleum evansii TaxID=59406 RepID=UPI00145F6B07|nr:hypothetical protein [Aromatoleum evansii]NMG28373.1 hypothetical protein [Aromatoleum evansii]
MLPGEQYEISSRQLISAAHSLQHAVAQTNRTKLLKAITQQANPYLDALNLRLAALVTHEYPDALGGSLLANAIADAADAYARKAENGGRLEDSEYAYVAALLHRSSAIADFSVHGIKRSGSELWRPFPTTLFEWLESRQFSTLIFTRKITSQAARHAALVFLSGHLLTFDRAALVADLLPHNPDCACHVD